MKKHQPEQRQKQQAKRIAVRDLRDLAPRKRKGDVKAGTERVVTYSIVNAWPK